MRHVRQAELATLDQWAAQQADLERRSATTSDRPDAVLVSDRAPVQDAGWVIDSWRADGWRP